MVETVDDVTEHVCRNNDVMSVCGLRCHVCISNQLTASSNILRVLSDVRISHIVSY